MRYEFKQAETEEEKQRIYRFRYQIYVEEMGRPTHADHKNKTITDFMDEKGYLFYTPHEGDLIAAARVNFARDGPIEFEEEYQLKHFPKYKGAISTTTKLMIRPEFRNGVLTPQFVSKLFEFGKNNGIIMDLINTNPPLDQFYERLGYRRFVPNFQHPEYGEVVPMVLVLSDVEYLKKMRSPFVRYALSGRQNGHITLDEIMQNFSKSD